MIKAVIFDMFETLVSMFSGDTYFSEDMATDLNIPVDAFKKAWHSTEHDRSCGNCTIEEGIKKALEMLGCYSEESVKLLSDKRKKNLEGIFERTPVDTIALLQEIKRRGIKIGLISNCYSDEADAIRKSSIFPYLDVALLSYEQGICKPDHEIYKKAMEELGITAEECLYVGDGGSNELFAARDLGMRCLQARYFADLAFEPHIPCYKLDDFKHAYKLSDILEKSALGTAKFYYKNNNAPKPNRPNHIGSTILIFHGEKVLMESRTDSNRWAFIGGGLFLTETLIECAIRETKEETGIELQEQDIVFKKLFDDPSIIIEYPDGNIIRSMMAVYQTELKEAPLLQSSEESKELKFFTPDELKTINVVETHIPILEEFFPEVVTHVDTVCFRKQ